MRDQLIKLGNAKPELRPHLRRILKAMSRDRYVGYVNLYPLVDDVAMKTGLDTDTLHEALLDQRADELHLLDVLEPEVMEWGEEEIEYTAIGNDYNDPAYAQEYQKWATVEVPTKINVAVEMESNLIDFRKLVRKLEDYGESVGDPRKFKKVFQSTLKRFETNDYEIEGADTVAEAVADRGSDIRGILRGMVKDANRSLDDFDERFYAYIRDVDLSRGRNKKYGAEGSSGSNIAATSRVPLDVSWGLEE